MSSKLSGVGLSVFTAGESNWADDMNANLLAIDTLMQARVLDKDLAAPPASPQAGDLFIVAASPSGAWAGKAKQLALYNGTSWNFYSPKKGYLVCVVDESKYYWFDAEWKLLQTENEPVDSFSQAKVRDTTLAGLEATAVTGAVNDEDTVLSAIAKFRAQISVLTAPPNYGDVTDIGGEGYYPFSQSDGILYTTSQNITIQPGFYRIVACGAYATDTATSEADTYVTRTLTSETLLEGRYGNTGAEGTQVYAYSTPITTPSGQPGKQGWLDTPSEKAEALKYLFSTAPAIAKGANGASTSFYGAHAGSIAVSNILHFMAPTQLTLEIGKHYDDGSFDMATAGTGFVWIREVEAP